MCNTTELKTAAPYGSLVARVFYRHNDPVLSYYW